MKKLKNGSHFVNINCMENLKLPTPPKVWVSGFLGVNRNGISVSAIMKKLKNGSHFVNINHMEKIQITNPPKVWVSSFLGVNRNGISVSAIMKKLKNGSHFVNINRMEKQLKHLCVVYPTSHLYVVLHFLIFSNVWLNLTPRG